jgi:hypothetical protein
MAQAKERESTTRAAAQVDTIRITLKLFALLSPYLPDGAK